MIVEEIDELRAQLYAAKRECDLLRRDNARLEASLYFKEINSGDRSAPKADSKKEDSGISTQEKLALFRSLFRGREDVYALRWESKKGIAGYSPACAHEWDPAFCNKPKTKCGECVNRTLLPLTESVIYEHLAGKHTVGVYPLLEDDTCWFLAADFDKKSSTPGSTSPGCRISESCILRSTENANVGLWKTSNYRLCGRF